MKTSHNQIRGQQNQCGGRIIIHKTDARNSVKNLNGALADLDRPTLKNTEDVKKSCVSGSNRSCPISKEQEKDGYSRASQGIK